MNFIQSNLEIETISICNRKCPTCIRNSYPDREAVKEWFEVHYMPTEDILGIVQQAYNLGFRRNVNLSRYNEPLHDERLPELGREIKKIGKFENVMFHSNGDLLTEDLAKELDGVFDLIVFSLNDSPKQNEIRKAWVQSQFKETELIFVSGHIIVHHFPIPNILELGAAKIDLPCFEPDLRIMFDFKGELVLCCEEVAPVYFKFGKFPEQSVEELLSGEYYNYCKETLKHPGGRREFELCSTCPRG